MIRDIMGPAIDIHGGGRQAPDRDNYNPSAPASLQGRILSCSGGAALTESVAQGLAVSAP